jgi:hypothetical protein
MPNPSAQQVNHFHSQTTIEGSTPILGMPKKTMTSMFGQEYTHTAPSFTIRNPGLAPYTFGYNGRACPNTNISYQDTYTTIAYTDPIPLRGSSLSFLPKHAYQNTPRFNSNGQPKVVGFGFETLPQFPFRLQLIDIMPP